MIRLGHCVRRSRVVEFHCDSYGLAGTMKKLFVCSGFVALAGVAMLIWTASRTYAQQTGSATTAAVPQPAASPQKALLDRYCVTCHNQKLKTAGLMLDKFDLSHVSEDAETWEKVIRKMRAGVMPPPGMRRPPRPEYEGLRDWLENEID